MYSLPYTPLLFLYRMQKSVINKPHSSKNFFKFSAGCQPRHPVKMPLLMWKSLSPPHGLQLYLSCKAQCPIKASNEVENYPAPPAVQLLTMLLHQKYYYFYFYYTQSNPKINYKQPIVYITLIRFILYFLPRKCNF